MPILTELPWVFTVPLEKAEVPYMIVGAYATMAFGIYRTTSDLDLVLGLSSVDIPRFEKWFPEEDYYRPPTDTLIAECRRTARGHFNLVHQSTQERADCYLLGKDSLQKWALENRRRITHQDGAVWVAPPEAIILKKLEFYKEGESEKHIRDIRALLQVVELNTALLEAQIKQLGLEKEWAKCEDANT